MMASPPTHSAIHGPSDAVLGRDERRQVAELAARVRQKEPALGETGIDNPLLSCGRRPGPSIILDNQGDRESTPARAAHTMACGYRARLLGHSGDIVLIDEARDLAFEDYCRATLGLGEVEVLSPPSAKSGRRRDLVERCLGDATVIERLAGLARRADGVTLIPFIGSAAAWALADRVARLAEVPVAVAAPPPRLSAAVGDADWFAERAAGVLDRRERPARSTVRGMADFAKQVAAISELQDSIAVDVPDDLGRSATIVLDARTLREVSRTALKHRLQGMAATRGWTARSVARPAVWAGQVLSAPSVQVSIPLCEEGSPQVIGLFSCQASEEFVGYELTDLPARWQYHIAAEALYLAGLLQALGYVGPIALQALLAGDTLATANLLWVGAQAGWTDLAIAATVVARVLGDVSDPAALCVSRAHIRFPPRRFEEVLDLSGTHALRPGYNDEGVVFLSPAGLSQGSGVHIAAIGTDPDHARTEAIYAMALLEEAPTHAEAVDV